MRIVTWNINSLRLRLSHLHRIVQLCDPDLICLQETKVPDHLFPMESIIDMGYPYIQKWGMKGYNGVAILSRVLVVSQSNTPKWCMKDDCRYLSVTLNLPYATVVVHNFYMPAGGDIPDPIINSKFAYKLDFIEEITHWFTKNPPANAILVGDLNIAPLANDVWSHKQLLNVVCHTPIETARLQYLLSTGFDDTMRRFIPEDKKLFTWWSYRNQDWKRSNRGRRLDHIWTTPDLRPYIQGISVLNEVRGWDRPSDHVPVVLDLK